VIVRAVVGAVLQAAVVLSGTAPANALSVPLADWMGALPGIENTPLAELPLPGTHDSATADLSAASEWSAAGRADFGDAALAFLPKSAAAAWSRAQPTSVGRQLEDGIRYLDLRLSTEPDGHVYLEHGLRGRPVRQVLDEVGAFAHSHPREVVVLGLNRFTAFTDASYGELESAVTATVGDRLVPSSVSPRATLRQLWDLGRNVVLVDQSGRLANLGALDASAVYAPWPNTADATVMLDAARKDLLGHDHSRFFDWGAILTPSASAIVGGAFRGVTSLADFTVRDAHPPAAAWLSGLAPGRNLNIVTTDWYTDPVCGTSFTRLVLSRVDGTDPRTAPCDVRSTGSGTRWDGGDWSVHTWVDLTWDALPAATGYQVSLRPVPGGGCQVGTTETTSAAAAHLDRQNVAWAEYLCVGSQYDVSVRAMVAGGWQPWSAVRRIRL
jgi:hypothetical protein